MSFQQYLPILFEYIKVQHQPSLLVITFNVNYFDWLFRKPSCFTQYIKSSSIIEMLGFLNSLTQTCRFFLNHPLFPNNMCLSNRGIPALSQSNYLATQVNLNILLVKLHILKI